MKRMCGIIRVAQRRGNALGRGNHLTGRRFQVHYNTRLNAVSSEFAEGKARVVVFNGIKFRRYPDAEQWSDRVYYRPHAGHIRRGVGYLHQEIWKAYNGPIPEGYHVHHKDGNPLNNTIENLELLKGFEHLSLHAQSPEKKEQLRANIKLAIAAATKWHRSPEGREWHRKHGKRTWEKRVPIKKVCDQCGKEFDSITRRDNNRFCSNACKSKWRRDHGVDNETRECVICGSEFEVNKYAKTRTCSRRCAKGLADRSRHGDG